MRATSLNRTVWGKLPPHFKCFEIIRSKRIIAEKEGILGQKYLASRLTGNTMVLVGRMHNLEPVQHLGLKSGLLIINSAFCPWARFFPSLRKIKTNLNGKKD